ncbi:MAG: sirohydrochlorin nickelochelatase [Candidatus Bathyarchaeales archaeon]
MDNVGLILIGHGSELPQYKENLEKLAEILRAKSKFKVVEISFMIKNKPTINEAVDIVVKMGVKKVVLIPVFLAPGTHTEKDIPEILGLKKGEHMLKTGELEIIYGEPIGPDRRLAEIIEEKALNALNQENKADTPYALGSLAASDTLFKASISKIRHMLKGMLEGVPREHARVIERVVHATADPEFAKLIVIHEKAVEAGVNTIKSGAKVVTDVKMVKAGINTAKLEKFGGSIASYVDDKRAVKLAFENSITRTAAAMRLAIEEDGLKNAVVVIGNSPTATFELADAVKKGKAKPALIIATPVGFMGAAEAKEEVLKLSTPFITVRGPKGGSPIAAAIFNALLSMAEEQKGV